MKRTLSMLVVLALFGFATGAGAAAIYKINNTTSLNSTASWSTTSGAQTPNPGSIGSTDAVYFNEETMLGSKTVSLGGDLALGGLALDYVTTNNANSLTINAGNTLTLNGITLYGAGKDGAGGSYSSAGILLNRGSGGTMTINCDVVVGANQTWTMSRNLTVGGSVDIGTKTLSFNVAGGTTLLSGALKGSGTITKTGGSNFNLLGDGANFTGTITNTSTQALALGKTTAKYATSVSSTSTGYIAVYYAGDTYIQNISTASGSQFRGDYGDAGTKNVFISQTVDAGIAGTINQGTRTFNFTKTGSATLTISSSSSDQSGTTTVNEGTLKLGSANALGTTVGGTTVNIGGVLDLNGQTIGAEALSLNGTGISSNGALINSSATAASLSGAVTLGSTSSVGGSGHVTLSGNVSGTSIALTKVGSNNLVLTGSNNTFTGSVTVNNGYVVFANLNAENGAPTVALNGGNLGLGSVFVGNTATIGSLSGNSTSSLISPYYESTNGIKTLSVNQTMDGDYAGVIEGTNSARDMALTKTGSAKLTLSGSSANTYTGLTTLNSGTLLLAKNDGVVALAGNVTVGAGATLATDDGKSGRIADTANVTIDGTGANFQFGANQNDTINTLAINNGGLVNIGGTGSNLRPDGGITSTGGGSVTGSSGNAGFNFNGSTRTVTVSDNTLAVGVGINNGGLTKAGAGKLTLTGSNSYTGTTTISDGTLQIGDGTTNGSISSSSGITNNGALIYDVKNATTSSYSNAISGSGTLKKDGAGTLVLSGTNTYNGNTSVVAGVLEVDGSLASQVTASGVGTTVKGHGTFQGGLILDSGTKLAPGNSPGTMTINVEDLTLSSGSEFIAEITGALAGTEYDQVVFNTVGTTSDLILNGATLTVSLANDYTPTGTYTLFTGFGSLSGSGMFSNAPTTGSTLDVTNNMGTYTMEIGYNTHDITLTVIPEPGTAGIVATFLAAALLRKRRFG